MKSANLFWTSVLVFSSSAGFSQAAANSAVQSSQTAGASAGKAAVSGSSLAGADASAARDHVNAAATESSAAAAQAGKASAVASQTSNVAAELTQKVNSKNARVGDQVLARTTSKAQLADGTGLPKGTRLLGAVTEADAKSSARHDGHLVFAFDRAVLRDGREIPIHATLQSISAPVSASALAEGSDDFAAAAAPVAISGGGSGRVGGGLLGGGGGLAVPHTGLVSGATSTIAQTPARVTGTANSATHTAGAAMGSAVNRGSAVAGQTAASVSNLPGLTASGSTGGSTALDAHGSNVDLASGTQMMFSVSTR
jgi:hypothetical protein